MIDENKNNQAANTNVQGHTQTKNTAKKKIIIIIHKQKKIIIKIIHKQKK